MPVPPADPSGRPPEPPAGVPLVGGTPEEPVVVFHFPVHVEVRAAPDPIDPSALADLVLTRLARHLGSA